MKHAIQTVILVSGALSLTIGAVAKVAADANEEGKVALICYQWDGFPDERLRVSIRKPAAIRDGAGAGGVGPHRRAHRRLRRRHCADRTRHHYRRRSGGTTHMGIYSIGVRGNGGAETCRTVNWNCSAPVPVRAPEPGSASHVMSSMSTTVPRR